MAFLSIYNSHMEFKNLTKYEKELLIKTFTIKDDKLVFVKKNFIAKYDKRIIELLAKTQTNQIKQELKFIQKKIMMTKFWPDSYSFYDGRADILPIGFLNRVVTLIDFESVFDFRNKSVYIDTDCIIKLPGFREEQLKYQVRALLLAITKRTGIINLSMSAGKTLIFICLAHMLRRNGVLILTDKVEVLKTIVDKFKSYVPDLDVGILHGNKKQYDYPVVISTIQTLNGYLRTHQSEINRHNVVIIDEAHHVKTMSYIKFLSKSNASIRLGFSGTVPSQGTIDYMKIIQYLGPEIIELTPKTLIDMGLAAKPIIRYVHTDSIKVNEFRESIVYNVIMNSDKLLKITKIVELHAGKKILIVTDESQQGRILSKVFNRLSIPNLFLTSSVKIRNTIMDEFKRKSGCDVLIATSLIDEGVDIPEIAVIILAYPRKNYRQVFQRIGRGMRLGKNKVDFLVYDFLDEQDHFLKSQFKKRMLYYQEQGLQATRDPISFVTFDSLTVQEVRNIISRHFIDTTVIEVSADDAKINTFLFSFMIKYKEHFNITYSPSMFDRELISKILSSIKYETSMYFLNFSFERFSNQIAKFGIMALKPIVRDFNTITKPSRVILSNDKNSSGDEFNSAEYEIYDKNQ